MYQRILVPVDGSATSDHGLEQAIAVARLTGGRILLAHVLDELVFTNGFETGATYLNTVLPNLRRRSAQILEAARGRVAAAGVPVEAATLECFARRTSDVIVEQAGEWDADLSVLGTHGRRGVGRLVLGSDAEQVLRMSPVPVLLVRGPEDSAGAPALQASADPAAVPASAATRA
jgi:nucleotide-binding universal stress UspA family protein